MKDLEKKFAANLRYLEEQTAERELERDDFHRETEALQRKLQEAHREREKLEELVQNQKIDLDEVEQRLREEATRGESRLAARTEKLESELRIAIEKICELREIIRDLEEQIDESTNNVGVLKDENEQLREELERVEFIQREAEQAVNSSHETFVTANAEWTADELYAQIQELAGRLQKKLTELDNFKWSFTASRPGSGSSGQISVSTEDVSVRYKKLRK